MPEALIFDVDGTLAETEETHRAAFNEAFAAAGLDWHWDVARYQSLLETAGGKERIARYVAEEGLPAPDIAALHRDKTHRYAMMIAAGHIAPRPGITRLVAEARRAGWRLGIATTTSRPNIDALSLALFQRPADEVFDAIAAGDEVPAKKPAPDVYQLALQRLGVATQDAAAVEDSFAGLCAARAAGLACVVAPGRYTTYQDLSGADLLLEDLGDLRIADIATLIRVQA
ncbi:HAD family hydrolase [Paracoccus suum]|uniref:HAD family hydrolase n=1 Tax=Paracoccus suum TaxID=2259340 RepID=A0A344PM09_9RHOB|nr:HAD-IA family hydrolase [Paracoccus suum]AXC50414.1 HAD family hydrolase [Paracoccus suum]